MISAPLTARVDGIAGLREQLADMRAALIERLVSRIDGGSLALLGSVGGALDALDHQLSIGRPEPATRAVVSDNGQEIRLTLYGEAGVPLSASCSTRRPGRRVDRLSIAAATIIRGGASAAAVARRGRAAPRGTVRMNSLATCRLRPGGTRAPSKYRPAEHPTRQITSIVCPVQCLLPSFFLAKLFTADLRADFRAASGGTFGLVRRQGGAPIGAVRLAVRAAIERVGDADMSQKLTGPEVATIRTSLGLRQTEFSRRYRIPYGTVAMWEQGHRNPNHTSAEYLRLIARHPATVARMVAGEFRLPRRRFVELDYVMLPVRRELLEWATDTRS